jgi:hypothetical protein
MLAIGIIAGLLAATFQSLSYLFSRGYVMRKLGTPIELVLVSQGAVVLPVQWVGVAVATAAVLLLNFSGGRLPLRATMALVIACIAYSLSDTFIRALVLALEPLPVLHASIFATSISYILCGITSLPIILFTRKASAFTRGLRFSLPFSLCWLTGMFALFTAFGSVGTVLGNILQSSRGIISILISIPAVRLGFAQIEPRVPRKVLLQRLAAALLIVAAVWLYASQA